MPLRWILPEPERWHGLLQAGLPFGLKAGAPRRVFHRDVHFDTPSGDLRRRGMVCRIRYRLDDRRWLVLETRDGVPVAGPAAVSELDAPDILAGGSEPARRLRGLVDPARLVSTLELETDREERPLSWPPVPLVPARAVRETVTARAGEITVEFEEASLMSPLWARPLAARLGAAVARR
ncbi:MAG TPA: hypothetical protein VFX28_08585, partial [Methylomirabilota bacterium]|nr:hypothetical protein [Methylomirabilota bacterium]